MLGQGLKQFGRHLLGAAVMGLVWLAPVMAAGPAVAGALPPLEGETRKLIVAAPPKPVAAAVFRDEADAEITLEAFRGKVVLVNLWATWCIPCRAEMPALDRLQGLVGSPKFQVVAIAQDRGGRAKVEKFLSELQVKSLKPYLDTSMKSGRAWGAVGLPTTLLINPEGLEVARLVGEAEWDAPEMVRLIKGILPP